MKYNLTKKDNIYEVVITIDKGEWDAFNNSAYEKSKHKFNVAGFRKGHAPKSVIEKNYGTGAFMNEALDEAYYKAYTQILSENANIKPIDAPKLDINKFDENGVEMTMTIMCTPEFEIAKYKGLTFTKQLDKVDDKQVEETIDRDLLRGSRLIETKEPVKDGDFVTLDFDGYVDGVPFPGGKADNYQLKIGSKTFIDTFEEQLVGLNIGDKKDVVVTFPKTYHESSLSGKPATFKIEIKSIRTREMPVLDDEFVKSTTEFKTVDEYKQGIKNRLNKEAEDKAELELDNDILDKIIDDTILTIPDVMAEEEYNRQLKGMEQQMKYQGITLADYAKYTGKSEDDLKQEIKLSAARNIKARLVLEKLIYDEKLDINENDIDNKIKEMAKDAKKDYEEYAKEVNNEMKNRIANEILMKNLVDFLRANNEIK